MSFSIKLRTSEFAKSRLVSGPVWLKGDQKEFPTQGWNDFPVIILGWWLEEIERLVEMKGGKAECSFMDGPYKFEVDAGPGSWFITFITRRRNGVERLPQKEVSPKVVVSEILKASRIVADVCRERGWESRDLTILESHIKRVDHRIQS